MITIRIAMIIAIIITGIIVNSATVAIPTAHSESDAQASGNTIGGGGGGGSVTKLQTDEKQIESDTAKLQADTAKLQADTAKLQSDEEQFATHSTIGGGGGGGIGSNIGGG